MRQSASFELLCVGIGSGVLAVGVSSNLKTKKKKNKRHGTRIFHHYGEAKPLNRSPPNFAGLVESATRDVITLAKFKVNWSIIVALVSG